MSILDAKNPSFPMVSFEYENLLLTHFLFKTSSLNSWNATSMVYIFLRNENMYTGGAISLSTSFPFYCLNDIMNICVHYRSHHSSTTALRGHFLLIILNGETIDIFVMIFRIIVHQSTLP